MLIWQPIIVLSIDYKLLKNEQRFIDNSNIDFVSDSFYSLAIN